MLSPSSRLLAQSLLAIACGAVACDDGRPAPAAQAYGAGEGGGSAPSAGSGSGEAGSAGAADSAVDLDRACLKGVPLIVDGAPSGMVRCEDGTMARAGPVTCRLADLEKDPQCPLGSPGPGPMGICDTVCDAGAFGRPRFAQFRPDCAYFCRVDADCPSDTVCACTEAGIGQCVQGPCSTNADCSPGASCRVTDPAACRRTGGFRLLECIGAEDRCVRDEDCRNGAADGGRGGAASVQTCGDDDHDGAKQCRAGWGPICGRPIFVADQALLAPLLVTWSWV